MSDNFFQYPVWTRSIELDVETMQYKTDIRQFLAFFEYYLNEIIDVPEKEARVNMISTENGLELQVISLDFTADQVDQHYNQFITFLAEPEVIDKVIEQVETDENDVESTLAKELLVKLIKIKKQVVGLENALVEDKNDNDAEVKENLEDLKNKILETLTEKQILEKDKQYFQEIIRNFSRQNINIINNNAHSMTQNNLSNNNINNSGNIVFGNNYSDLVTSAKQKIVEMVQPGDEGEDKLIQIQAYLLEILELLTTNQDLHEGEKEMGIRAVDKITDISKHNSELDTKNEGLVQKSLETISSIFNTVGATITNIETIKNLAGVFGLKI